MKQIKPGSKFERAIQFDRAAINEESRTVELAFSSEEPYARWWGVEVLDHKAESIRLNRLKSGGPLLMDHDSRDHVGVIESVTIGADLVGRAVVRFGKSARAEEVFQDVKDGIRKNVSVGYMIHKAQLEEKSDDQNEPDTYRVTDWEPHEISLVSVPADSTVGVGRSADIFEEIKPAKELVKMVDTTEETSAPEINERDIQEKARKAELKRVSEIIAIGDAYKDRGMDKLATEAVRSGMPVDAFRAEVLDKIAVKGTESDIGLTKKEAKQFSFLRALHALANPTDRRAQEAAAFERECSEAYGTKIGKEAQGFYVPVEVQRRDLEAGTATAGGHTVATDLLSESFIDMLRNRMVVRQMGAQVLTGLEGNIAIPRQTGGATAYWVAESGAPTESQQAFDQVPMSPETVGAFTDISRKLLLQSSIDIESFVRRDLATTLALELDRVAIHGTGSSNQPEGILNVTGIGSVAGGTNGGSPTWDHIVDLETAVAADNADIGSLGYMTNAKVRGKLKKTFVDGPGSGERVWHGGATPLNGYTTGVTNQVSSTLTKGTASGVCSAIIFGNWSDLIIGQWGTLDLTVDPYTHSTSGTVRVVVLQDADLAVRHAESFAAMLDALTA